MSAIILSYTFNSGYRYAAAPPLVESAGRVQYTEFNTFIGHENTVVISNSRDEGLQNVRVIVDNLDALVLKDLTVNLPARGTQIISVSDLPRDTYGLIRVEASGVGLIVSNEQIKRDQYKLVHGGS